MEMVDPEAPAYQFALEFAEPVQYGWLDELCLWFAERGVLVVETSWSSFLAAGDDWLGIPV